MVESTPWFLLLSQEHVQNATLAGGVAIGTAADLAVQPVGALVVGTVAGAVSVIGFEKITVRRLVVLLRCCLRPRSWQVHW